MKLPKVQVNESLDPDEWYIVGSHEFIYDVIMDDKEGKIILKIRKVDLRR